MNPPALEFNRIVCGVDFSPLSVAAFLTAAELARSVNAELHVLHVIEAYPPTGSRLFDTGQDHAQSLERTATGAMQTLVAQSPATAGSIRVTTEITPGAAFVELPLETAGALLQEFVKSEAVFGAFAKHWHLGLGLTIIASVALLPRGLVGLPAQWRRTGPCSVVQSVL